MCAQPWRAWMLVSHVQGHQFAVRCQFDSLASRGSIMALRGHHGMR
jgi:hypothetical protein